jgi:hypothetical protein
VPVAAPVPVPEEKPAPTEPASLNDTGTHHASKGWSPTVFWVGVGATALVGGVSVWSGIDTKNSPGVDKVREECAGKTTSCSAYQTGKDKEMRTNILWAATGGLAVATAIIGVFATDWGTSEKTASDEEHRTLRQIAVAPWVDGTSTGVFATGRF